MTTPAERLARFKGRNPQPLIEGERLISIAAKVPEDLAARLGRAADARGVTRSTLIRQIVQAYLNTLDDIPPKPARRTRRPKT